MRIISPKMISLNLCELIFLYIKTINKKLVMYKIFIPLT